MPLERMVLGSRTRRMGILKLAVGTCQSGTAPTQKEIEEDIAETARALGIDLDDEEPPVEAGQPEEPAGS
jgi:hypothetical protein